MLDKIKENIIKNQEKLAKNEALLQKRIEKAVKLADWLKENNITNYDEAVVFDRKNNTDEAYNAIEFVNDWSKSIKFYKDENGKTHNSNERGRFETEKIEKIKQVIEKWNDKLVKESLIQNKLESIPETIKEMFEYIKASWLEFELNRKNNLKAELNTMSFKEFINKYSYEAYRHANKPNEEIIKEVETDVKYAVIDLINRVSETAGEIKSWEGIKWNGKALNGIIEGSKNTVKVETIMAGGYNIQRLHYRVLIHKI